jgi:multidrug efflux pump subunit AcrA (membrane-fusion protein)
VTDPALWAQVLAWWAGKKYNPVKVGDMLDVYRHPERMAHRNGTHATHRSIPKNRELEAQLAQEHQQARAELETARADAEAEQAARLQQRRAMYGTQPEDVTWWAAAREEIFYATNANVHRLVRDTELLELRHDTVRIAVPDEEAQRALAHPPSLKAIERTLSRFVNHPLTLVVEVFA